MSKDTLEAVTWGAAILAFLTIAYKSYTGDTDIPTSEEILRSVRAGSREGTENAMRENAGVDAGVDLGDVSGTEKADLN